MISTFVVRCLDSFYIWYFKPLASFCGCAGRFVSYLVENPEDRFSRDVAYLIMSSKLRNAYSKRSRAFHHYMSYVMRKPVFGVFDQVRLKPACSASEASYSHEILDLASIGIILSRQRTTKAQISLRGCEQQRRRSACADGFSHDVAHIATRIN